MTSADNPEIITPEYLLKRWSIEELCINADNYFKKIPNPTFHLATPFSNFIEAPEILYNLGLLFSSLKLCKTMVTVDFGSGVCWLSRLLNQMGCSTISVDCSKTALEIGKSSFEKYPPISDTQQPKSFIVFDGKTIDLPDNSVDRIICFDSFHHIPNQRVVLQEFFRILKNDGIAGFCESGRDHSKSAQAQYEMKNYAVLENDIIIEDIEKISKEIGFNKCYLKFLGNRSIEIDVNEYLSIVQNKIPKKILSGIISPMRHATIFYLTKEEYLPDSRSDIGLSHSISLYEKHKTVKQFEPFAISVTIQNTGTAKWLSDNINGIGVVKLGIHLFNDKNELINLDFFRSEFNQDILPGNEITNIVTLSFNSKGTFRLLLI